MIRTRPNARITDSGDHVALEREMMFINIPSTISAKMSIPMLRLTSTLVQLRDGYFGATDGPAPGDGGVEASAAAATAWHTTTAGTVKRHRTIVDPPSRAKASDPRDDPPATALALRAQPPRNALTIFQANILKLVPAFFALQ
jgi:hypothetical protein